jgi:hypothetical protein
MFLGVGPIELESECDNAVHLLSRKGRGLIQVDGRGRAEHAAVQSVLTGWMLLLDVFRKQKFIKGLADVVCALQIFLPNLAHIIFNFLSILDLVDANL